MEWEYDPYGITDNGYHYWKSCQFPVTVSSDPPLVRWSKRAESVRKVSECQYGSVKDGEHERLIEEKLAWSVLVVALDHPDHG